LGVVLFAAVGLSFGLALQGYFAARSHRQTTEAVLRDYAHVAAGEYARTATVELSRFFDVAFDEVPRRARGDLPDLDEVDRELEDVVRVLDCYCPGFLEPVAILRVLLPGERLDVQGGPISESTVAAIVAQAREQHALDPSGRYGLLHVDPGVADGASAIAYASVSGEGGAMAAVYAILLDGTALRDVAAYWQATSELLPSALAKGLPTDSLLSVTLARPDGTPVFQSSMVYEQLYAAADTMSPALGSMVASVAIRPQAAASLVIGGLPTSRLPMSLALVALTLAVGAVGLLQIRRYEQLSRLREDFVSSVSHELRTPLTQIRMLGELLSDDKLRAESERSRALQIIRRESTRLTQLVENILQFSRIRAAPPGPVELRDVDLDDAVREVIASFQPIAEAAGATVLAQPAPGLAVRGQREGVRRILMNLLDNAIKYGPAGQVVQVRAAAENGSVRLVVEDQGPGVPETERQRIWDPYWRLPRDLDGQMPGSGMGLAVVRSLTEQYGGSAWVESSGTAPGSRFVVELPRASAAVAGQGSNGSRAAGRS